MYPISNMPLHLQTQEGEPEAGNLLLTAPESAVLLRCGLSTFHRWVARGIVGPPLKLGGTSRWPRSEILALIETAKARRDRSSA